MNSMSVITQETNRVAIELDAHASARLIERAQRMNQPLSLSFSRLNREESIVASIAGADAGALELIPAEGDPADLLPSICLEVSFTLDAQEYFFSSSVLSDSESRFEIIRPACLHTWQRRRFLRARLADSASITLTHSGSFTRSMGEGAMLNLSQDGLACRVSRQLADSLDIGESIGVVFELGSGPTPIKGKGIIKSKTAASSAQSTIIGVHFEDNAESREMRDQLAQLLGS